MWQRIYQGVTHYLFSLIVEVFSLNLRPCVFLASLLLRSFLLANGNLYNFFRLLRLLGAACLLLGSKEHILQKGTECVLVVELR